MIECNVCNGSGWVTVERGDITAAKRCACREVGNPAETGVRLTFEAAAEATTTLCELLDFSPSSEASRAFITDALMSMCATVEQVRWLVRRTAQLHVKWSTCGIPGLRQVFCSKYMPKDGLTTCSSEAYPEGIPSEKPLVLAVNAKALPPGHAVSASPSIEATVSDLSDAKRMPTAGDGLRIVPPVVRRIPEVQPNHDAPKITQADIDQEVERLRRAKAK
jgi:hypothetical protein